MSEISKIDKKFTIKKIDKETLNIQISDNNLLSSLVGEFNINLKHLEKLTQTNLFFRARINVFRGI